MPEVAILCDIGSTFTKVLAVDMAEPAVLGRSQHPTTAEVDVSIGLERALAGLPRSAMEGSALRLCSSSARGGLRLVAVGLVASLTAEAARQAALGAGARVARAYSHDLTASDVAEIEAARPDIVLLAGGTDGGDRAVIARNAAALAASAVTAPVIVAGNRVARDEVREILERGGKHCFVTENVLPELDRLNIDPARAVIREVFVTRIVEAKGLDRAMAMVDGIVMPTPAAVLAAAELLAAGTAEEPGFGDIMVVDVGGATTDVHSVATSPPGQGLVPRGLPEPVAKRTVEGDLGVRVSASALVGLASGNELRADLAAELRAGHARERAEILSGATASLAVSDTDAHLDVVMAAACVDLAVERHVGHVTEVYGPRGAVRVLLGKDLRAVKAMVGVGGVFALPGVCGILRSGLARNDLPGSMRPESPVLYLDAGYVMYAMGLLAAHRPAAALRLLKTALVRQE